MESSFLMHLRNRGIMKALQSKDLMEANISVYMQLKLSQPYGDWGSQIKIDCGLNQKDLE